MAVAIGIAEARRPGGGSWMVNGDPVEVGGESVPVELLGQLPVRAGANVSVTLTPTGTVVTATGGGVTNRYGWIPADYLYGGPTETLTNANGRAVFTRHDMTKTEVAGPISCPTPGGYTSNMTFRWYTYHTAPGTYAMACRWRQGGLKAWSYATSGLFQASTTLTNLGTASLSVWAPAPANGLVDMEYWILPTNAPGGGTAGGVGYVRGMNIELGDRM
jgi:hypothetical protein